MIRWITAQIGTAPATSPDLSEAHAVLDVRDLVDKAGNDPGIVRERLNEGVALLAGDKPLVVCCDYGMSRSNAVAAGILALADSIPLDEALRRVMAATGEREIKLAPIASVRAALEGAGRASKSGSGTRVLLTGGRGFIGSLLAKALEDHAEAVVVAGSELELESGALRLALLLEEHRIDQVIHLANPRVYTSNLALGMTLSMLRNAIEACHAASARLVFLSSWEIYSGYRAAELIADETLPARPKGPYGETKMLAEQLLDLHRRRHGLDAVIVRSSPVFGSTSDKPKFLFNFIRKARGGADTIVTHRYRNALPALDLLHVDDLIAALRQIITRRFDGDFNLGGGRLQPVAALAARIVAACGSRAAISVQPVDDDIANVRMDSARAQRLLGWKPANAIEDGLAELIAAVEAADA